MAILEVLVAIVVYPYVVFTDPKIWNPEIGDIDLEGETAPNNIAFVSVHGCAMRTRPRRFLVVDTLIPVLNMEPGQGVLIIQLWERRIWQWMQEYISIGWRKKKPLGVGSQT